MRARLVAAGWIAGAVVAWLLILTLDRRITGQPGLLAGRTIVLRLIMGWWVLLIPAVLLVRRVPKRVGVALVLAGLVGLQIAGMARQSSVQSDDAYRYAWEGRVQDAGVDPYRYAPTAPELTRFRDPWLWPDAAECARESKPAGCTRINYKDERTIYPPVAEAWFALVNALPGPHRDGKFQLYAGLAGLALTVLLMGELRASGRDPTLAAWYAWSPAAGLEVASDAHVDILAALLGVAALAAARRHRQGLGGGLLGAAIAVKIYPGLLVPVLLRQGKPVRAVVAAIAVVVVSYIPHVAAVGTDVIGFLPRYLSVEGYDQGTRFLLVRLIPGPEKVYAALILAALALAAYRGRVSAAGLVGGALLVATPVQTWYVLLLVALAVLEARPQWLAVAAAAYPLYNVGPPPDKLIVGTVWYGIAALIVLAPPFLRYCMNSRAAVTQPDWRSRLRAQASLAGFTAAAPGRGAGEETVEQR